ncbi:hypothetical protein CMQ_2396 [Grosmannia clavigera kw1407]|uniref:Asl1-like glycosyl hydrolase catalytic domain-containing protein n=1 Tax=Grosmannia clavigera (strain kw1407 / UAMH 11150) TaxID=655863 RepID=F0XIT4_GROCL|nr:uncharacterized protein CMQ_2396 [Grosmannia clavigera kw1407]EFX02347.1 hypothetical protein CMQ_2396 [Grosmannia clavigera kw1407]
MRSSIFTLSALPALYGLFSSATATSSAKRGLVFTPNASHPQDNYIWALSPSDLTWYYNYGYSPSPAFSNVTQDAFEFVPMLWGAPSDTSDTTFLDAVKSLISGGTNISHVLAFNEPDGSTQNGGSNVDPTVAAKVWVSNIIPLQKQGVKVGLPACTGGTEAIPWLNQMLANCSELISTSDKTANCTYDFIPLHWYGNFEGLASHIGTYAAAYGISVAFPVFPPARPNANLDSFPNASLWITEYNLDNQDLASSQSFYNTSAEYLDRLAYIERYSYFGAFRASASNVGPNAAMLSAGGKLTDIGAWYLGEEATGVSPTSTSSSAASRSWNGHSFGWDMLVTTLSVLLVTCC